MFGGRLTAELHHFSKYVVAEVKPNVTDVKGHWSSKFVESMMAKGFVTGYDGGLYKPENKVTRAEFATMLVKATGLQTTAYKGGFSDVAASYWAKDYIQTAKDAFGLAGTDGKFNPDQTITRAEMAVMLSKALKSTKTGTLSFADQANIPTWAKAAVSTVVAEELMQGANNEFRPLATSTRAEAATVLYKLFNK